MPIMFTRTRTAALSLVCAGLLLPAATAAASGTDRTLHARASWGQQIAEKKAHVPAHSAEQECADADLQPTAANAVAINAAILCLHNQSRAGAGVPALRENASLRSAAVRHARDMVSRRFFDHVSPDGSTMVDRIMGARYTSRKQAWSVGENIAWGSGSLATPRSIVRGWMQSPSHRANILKRAYRDIGIGVVAGTPTDGSRGATYTADFGVRR